MHSDKVMCMQCLVRGTNVSSSLSPAASPFHTRPDVPRSEHPVKSKGDASGANMPKAGKQERRREEARRARHRPS